MGPFKTFEDLECWKKCRELRLFVAKQVVKVIPAEEKYRINDQIIRAARSTTANIAEGYGRFHYLDSAKFCCNSRGSVYEVLDHLITAYDEDLIDEEMYQKGREMVENSIKLLNGYINFLREKSKEKPTT